jgi:hypothetical protein
MKPQKVKITHYTRSRSVDIQYGIEPTSDNYDLDTNAKKFALEILRLLDNDAIITVEIEGYKF